MTVSTTRSLPSLRSMVQRARRLPAWSGGTSSPEARWMNGNKFTFGQALIELNAAVRVFEGVHHVETRHAAADHGTSAVCATVP